MTMPCRNERKKAQKRADPTYGPVESGGTNTNLKMETMKRKN